MSSDKVEEWLKQSAYDLGTVEAMFQSRRYFYAVFMLHLSVEKALKGLYLKRLGEVPPKVHNLTYLLTRIGVRPPEDVGTFLMELNSAQAATRYPDDLAALQRAFTRKAARQMIERGKEALEWTKSLF
jgi:HEPN domain-containing protein